MSFRLPQELVKEYMELFFNFIVFSNVYFMI